jgi:hypothetical protein
VRRGIKEKNQRKEGGNGKNFYFLFFKEVLWASNLSFFKKKLPDSKCVIMREIMD